MKKKSRLGLSRQTIVQLSQQSLVQVAGGLQAYTVANPCSYTDWEVCRDSAGCGQSYSDCGCR